MAGQILTAATNPGGNKRLVCRKRCVTLATDSEPIAKSGTISLCDADQNLPG